jgi:hypothetical protein
MAGEKNILMKTQYIGKAALLLALLALPMAAGSITTTFAENNRFTGNMFNATIGASGITVNSLDVDVDAGAVTIDVWIKTGTYVGSETTPAAWTLESATAVTGAGAGNETLVNITPFSLSAGQTYGVYVTTSVTGDSAPYMYYTNGSNTYSNSDLSLSLGDGIGGQFGSLSVTPSRTWNGTINYTLAATGVPEPASWALFALAAPGFWLVRRRYLRKY